VALDPLLLGLLDEVAANARRPQMTAEEASGQLIEDGVDASHAPARPRTSIVADRLPLPLRSAVVALGRCFIRTTALLRHHQVSQPKDRIGQALRFADGSGGRVYRETVVRDTSVDAPALLVVAFKLRWVRGWGHVVFRAESVLNTPLFVGFPGFRSKLWLAHDENGVYRGFYEWDGTSLADRYARALWWVLALVSVRGSIRYVVIPGVRRDDVLDDPTLLDVAGLPDRPWWLLVGVDHPASTSDDVHHQRAGRGD
jgi:hypothetical protein